ncbi:MAG: hypothetical protein LBQ15_07920 [Clostridium sp.]|jgi:hypothetical protein|nr:hypothetical protein [Clostridium sp.]
MGGRSGRGKREGFADGGTVGDRNADGVPWYQAAFDKSADGVPGRRAAPGRSADGVPGRPAVPASVGEPPGRGQEPLELTPKEKRALLWGVLKASLLAAVLFLGVFGLFLLFCVFVWLR